MKKKYALALSGGGFKGAFQLGALNYLEQHWTQLTGKEQMHFDVVCGVSAGALNGALIASKQVADLGDLWAAVAQNGGKEIYQSQYINNEGKIQLNFDQLQKDLLPNFKINLAILSSGLWNAAKRIFNKRQAGFIKTILDEAEKEFDQNFSHFKSLADIIPLKAKLKLFANYRKIPEDTIYRCGLVSLNDGHYYSVSNRDFDENESFVLAILASASMPIIWPPVKEIHLKTARKTIRNAVDGGLRNNSPLADVVDCINADKEDAEYEVFIINCNSGMITAMDRYDNIADIAIRSLTEITLAEIFNDDIREFIKINSLVRQAKIKGVDLFHKGVKLREFNYRIIQPEGDELGDMLDSRTNTINRRVDLGYQKAEAAFESL